MKLDIVISAEDLASDKFRKVDRELQNVSKASISVDKNFRHVRETSQALVSAFRKIAIQAAAVFSAFQGLRSFVQVNAQFERFQTTLETLYKSHQKAQAVFDSILEFASKTPFEVDQLTEAWVRMKAMGLEPNLDMFRKIGDAVSALGGSQEVFDGIITALGQMQAKGKVSAEELMQLAERGIPAFDILKEKLGLTGEELENIGSIGLDVQTVINALIEGMGERFKGNMEKMSNTWSGIMSNLKDSWTRFMKLIGDSGAFASLKDIFKELQDRIQKAFDSGQAQKWATVIAKGFSIVATAVMGVGTIVWEFATGLYEIGKVILNALAQPFIIVYDTVKKIFTDSGYFEKVMMSIPEYLKAVGKIAITILPDAFLKALELIGLQIVKWSTIAFKPIVVAFTWVKDNLIAFGKTAVDKIGEVFHGLRVFVQNVFVKMFNFLANKFNSFIQNIANGLKKIPFMKGIAEKIEGFKVPLMVEVKADYKPLFSETEKAYKKFSDVKAKFEGDWKKALEYINQRSSELINGLDADAKRAIEILKTQGGEFGKITADILEKTYEAGAKSWEIVKQKIAKLKELTKNLSPELQKQIEELEKLVNKSAKSYKNLNKEIDELNKKPKPEKIKSFWEEFIAGVEKSNSRLAKMLQFFKNIYDKAKNLIKSLNWDKIKSFGKSAWKGLKSVFKGGAKQGETGVIARTKNAFSNIISGASVGGLVGAGAAFLTDQLMQNQKIRDALDKIFNAIQKIIEPIAEVIAPILESIAPIIESFKPVLKIIADSMKPIAWILRNISNGISKVINFFTSVAKPVWNGIKNIVEAIAKALKAVKKGVSDIWDKTGGKVLKAIGRAIPFFHQGGIVKPLVAHNGMYIGPLSSDEVPIIAQKGEYVVNRRATQKYKTLLDAINSGKEVSTGGITINNTINVYAENFDRRFVEDELIPLLEDLNRRGKLRWE